MPQMHVKSPTGKVVKHCSQLTHLLSHSTLAGRNASHICPFPGFITPKAVKVQQSVVKYISIFADGPPSGHTDHMSHDTLEGIRDVHTGRKVPYHTYDTLENTLNFFTGPFSAWAIS